MRRKMFSKKWQAKEFVKQLNVENAFNIQLWKLVGNTTSFSYAVTWFDGE